MEGPTSGSRNRITCLTLQEHDDDDDDDDDDLNIAAFFGIFLEKKSGRCILDSNTLFSFIIFGSYL